MSIRLTSVVAVIAATALTLVVAPSAQAAPDGKLQQFRVPTAGSSPMHITQASDGNFWFTESFVNAQNNPDHNVGRITPAGDVTEFRVCDFCFPTDIVQGSDGILYFTKNNAPLGRITTDGTVLPDAGELFAFNGNGLAAHGDDIWVTDFNNDVIWRYDIRTGVFTSFDPPTAGSDPLDVAVDAGGIVWFTEGVGQIGRLDPVTGVTTETVVTGTPREIRIASDGFVWFTERFDQAVGRLDPSTGTVTMFPLAGGPEDLAPAVDGSMWVTRTTGGNIARIGTDGVITAQSRVLKGSEPFGITVAPNGDPWFTMLAADKIATLKLQ